MRLFRKSKAARSTASLQSNNANGIQASTTPLPQRPLSPPPALQLNLDFSGTPSASEADVSKPAPPAETTTAVDATATATATATAISPPIPPPPTQSQEISSSYGFEYFYQFNEQSQGQASKSEAEQVKAQLEEQFGHHNQQQQQLQKMQQQPIMATIKQPYVRTNQQITSMGYQQMTAESSSSDDNGSSENNDEPNTVPQLDSSMGAMNLSDNTNKTSNNRAKQIHKVRQAGGMGKIFQFVKPQNNTDQQQALDEDEEEDEGDSVPLAGLLKQNNGSGSAVSVDGGMKQQSDQNMQTNLNIARQQHMPVYVTQSAGNLPQLPIRQASYSGGMAPPQHFLSHEQLVQQPPYPTTNPHGYGYQQQVFPYGHNTMAMMQPIQGYPRPMPVSQDIKPVQYSPSPLGQNPPMYGQSMNMVPVAKPPPVAPVHRVANSSSALTSFIPTTSICRGSLAKNPLMRDLNKVKEFSSIDYSSRPTLLAEADSRRLAKRNMPGLGGTTCHSYQPEPELPMAAAVPPPPPVPPSVPASEPSSDHRRRKSKQPHRRHRFKPPQRNRRRRPKYEGEEEEEDEYYSDYSYGSSAEHEEYEKSRQSVGKHHPKRNHNNRFGPPVHNHRSREFYSRESIPSRHSRGRRYYEQFDYEDEYMGPTYDDDYEEYEEMEWDRYDRRSGARSHRGYYQEPLRRRPGKIPKEYRDPVQPPARGHTVVHRMPGHVHRCGTPESFDLMSIRRPQTSTSIHPPQPHPRSQFGRVLANINHHKTMDDEVVNDKQQQEEEYKEEEELDVNNEEQAQAIAV